jgi:hypothetical protein
MNFFSKISLFVFVFFMVNSASSFAVQTKVTTVAQLQTAINNASNGDILVLANGTYLNNTLTINKNNITVKAETLGGVFLNGTNAITLNGDYITFTGFQITSGDIGGGNIISVNGDYNVISHMNIKNYYAKKYIDINAGTRYNEVSYCNLENKPSDAIIGCTIQINTSPTVPGYHKIRYCSFQHYPGLGGDFGNEPIRLGLGAESTNNSRTTVEYCYFNDVGLGDSESISVKCCENVIRYCTFTNNPAGMLVFRNGNRNVAYGNFFINGSGGIRAKEANDIYCYNNYFETAGVSGVMDVVTLVYVSPNLSNINFIHNTFVDCGNIDLGGTGPTTNTWANNIFIKTSGNIFTNANTGTTWAGNFKQGTLGISIASGMTNTDPQLTMNADGYYGLSASSPAINASSASYPTILDITNIDDDPSILLDINKQTRPADKASKDVGCDEYTTGTSTNHPLSITEVGPSYLVTLPVTLTKFSIGWENNTSTAVLVKWSTANEINTAHFNVQQSTDGINFNTIGKQKALGAGNYAYTDNHLPIASKLFYRLEIVDQDGSTQYSNVELLSVHQKVDAISIFPNPATSIITIKGNQLQYVHLMDAQGRSVLKKQLNGINVQTIQVGTLPSGIYIIQCFNQEGICITQKITIE